jgi:hypothetical protein
MALVTLAAIGLGSAAGAQVRTNLRSTMQIDGLLNWQGYALDERSWPLETTGFAAGDVDGDGDLDLLAAENYGHGRLWWNDGDGGFTRFVVLPTNRSGGCALLDADGDGDLDPLFIGGGTSYATSSAGAVLYRNDGGGTFTMAPPLPSQSFLSRCVVTGDVDGDGDHDAIVFQGSGGFPPSGARLWRSDGAGAFTDATALAFPSPVVGQYGVLADVEPDGDLDVVTAANLHRNDGLGFFTVEPPIPWLLGDAESVFADVDGDALVDQLGVAAAQPFVRRNLGGGVFQDVSGSWFEPHALIDRTAGWSAHACLAFDADADGDVDFVAGGSEQRGMSSTTVGIPPKLFLNSSGQRFVDAGRPALPMLQDSATAVAAGDIDGDRDVDLVFGYWNLYQQSGSPWTRVWRQDAAGRFGEDAVPFATTVSALTLADVDADGDLDLVGVVGWGPVFPGVPGQHRLALNDGSGNFTDVTTTHMPASANTGGASCVAGDVDGDGDVDLVIGSYSPNWGGTGVPLMLLCNNGTGIFSDASSQLPATSYESSHLALRDFDADGDLDIVVAANSAHPNVPPILCFVNGGTGTFVDATAARMPATGPASGLCVLDLDGDGDLDIAQTTVDLWNDGTGTFTATAAPATPAPRVLVTDLDGTGAPDVIVGGTNGIAVAGGPSLFTQGGAHDNLVVPVDLDRDDDLDLVMAPAFGHGGAVWTMLRIELLYNLRRDLRVATLPRLGHPYRLQLRATNGTNPTVAFVAVATATLPQPLAIPGWGELQLDPATMIPFAAVAIPDADTAAEASFVIPNQPSLFGLPLSCQALFVPIGNEAATRLSNVMTFPIER